MLVNSIGGPKRHTIAARHSRAQCTSSMVAYSQIWPVLEPGLLQTGTDERRPQDRYVPHTYREASSPCSQPETATTQNSRAQSSVPLRHPDAILSNAGCTTEMLLASTFHFYPRFPILMRKGLQTRAKISTETCRDSRASCLRGADMCKYVSP